MTMTRTVEITSLGQTLTFFKEMLLWLGCLPKIDVRFGSPRLQKKVIKISTSYYVERQIKNDRI